MRLIADEQVIFESPDPKGIYCYTPALCRGRDGRLVAAVDLGGPGTEALDGPRSAAGNYPSGNQVRFLLSDDGGATWRKTAARVPMMHEILFAAGGALYALGHAGALCIARSDDNGETWSEPSVLDAGHHWHQSSCAVDFHDGRVHLVYEQRLPVPGWPKVMPVFMAARVDDDLRRRGAWTFSEPFNAEPLCDALRATLHLADMEYSGVLETNVVRQRRPGALGYDPDGRTWLLLARVASGTNAVGAALKGVRRPDGTLAVETFGNRSSGLPLLLVPFPGGGLKFHLGYDDASALFWMVASPARAYAFGATDGGRCDRRQLCLYYGPDGLAWRCAGTVAFGPCEHGARHYAQLLFDDGDLLVLSRSGDERACSAHDNNLVTFHRVRDFRALADETYDAP